MYVHTTLKALDEVVFWCGHLSFYNFCDQQNKKITVPNFENEIKL
jgi:hypothetical protein